MSRNTIIVGALALAAVVGGVLYFTDDSTEQPAATTSSASNKDAGRAPAAGGTAPHDAMSQGGTAPGRTDARPLPPDPRLAALQVSPDNGLIKFVTAANGKVIAEIDQDPASLGFGKPTREYTYAGDKVVGLTAYRYMSDHVEISRTMVAYKPDGSVDQIRESTSYQDKAGKSP